MFRLLEGSCVSYRTTMMTLTFSRTLQAWGSREFNNILKAEIQRLDLNALPLQQGLSQGSYASDEHIHAVILNTTQESGYLHAKVGIFYTGMIAGCHCADDPGPSNETNEYCEVLLTIDERTAETTVTLLPS